MGVNTRISTHSYLWLSTRPWMMAGKKQRPRRIAIIEPDYCTGCRACVEVCPVDCIEEVPLEQVGLSGPGRICDVRVTDCTGCSACERICPWHAVGMVSTERVEQAYGLEPGTL